VSQRCVEGWGVAATVGGLYRAVEFACVLARGRGHPETINHPGQIVMRRGEERGLKTSCELCCGRTCGRALEGGGGSTGWWGLHHNIVWSRLRHNRFIRHLELLPTGEIGTAFDVVSPSLPLAEEGTKGLVAPQSSVMINCLTLLTFFSKRMY
jgi:hypothetical protein